MRFRTTFSILFLSILCITSLKVDAAGSIEAGDITKTPQSSELKKMRKFLLSNPTQAELKEALRREPEIAAFLTRSDDDRSEAARLGALFQRLRKAIVNEKALAKEKAKVQSLNVHKFKAERALAREREEVQRLKAEIQALRQAPEDLTIQRQTELTTLQTQYVRLQGLAGLLASFIAIDKIVIPLAKKLRKRFQKKKPEEQRSFREQLRSTLKMQ